MRIQLQCLTKLQWLLTLRIVSFTSLFSVPVLKFAEVSCFLEWFTWVKTEEACDQVTLFSSKCIKPIYPSVFSLIHIMSLEYFVLYLMLVATRIFVLLSIWYFLPQQSGLAGLLENTKELGLVGRIIFELEDRNHKILVKYKVVSV